MKHNPLTDLLQPYALEAAKKEVNQLPPAELVQALLAIAPGKRALAFRLLDKDKAITVFEYLKPEQQAELVQGMESPNVIRLVESLPEDDRVRLFDELPAKVTKRIIANLSESSRASVNTLLGYREGCAGRIMNLRFLAVRVQETVGMVLSRIAQSNLEENELSLIFVVDEQRFYKGFVRALRLLKADPQQTLHSLVEGQDIFIRATDRDTLAARLLKENNLPAIPVLDSEGRLLGDITFDDVIDVIEEEAEEAVLAQGGIGVTLLQRDQGWSERLVRGPIIYSVKLRLLFLVITLIGGFIVGGVIETFEETLEAVLAAAVFIPVVMDMGGNTGTQSSTIFARGLAWQQIGTTQLLGYLWRETRIGLIMGAILGSLGGLIALVWQGLPNEIPEIGLAVGLSLFAVITLGAFLGASLPMLMIRLGLDHGPGADPFITTVKDFTGLLLYFYLVSLFINVAELAT